MLNSFKTELVYNQRDFVKGRVQITIKVEGNSMHEVDIAFKKFGR